MLKKRIILLHGWGANTEKLEPLRSELQDLGWNVFLPNLPGFDTQPPDSVWGIGDYALYVLRESEKFFKKERFFVFGHSFGGAIAIKLVSSNPKKVAGVILCAAGGISRGRLVKRLAFNVFAKGGKALLFSPKLAAQFRKLLYKAAREHDYEKTQGVMREVFKKIISENLRPLLLKIKSPTLILWGEDDKMTPAADAYFLKTSLENSELAIFKNQGHRLPYEKPIEVAKKIDLWVRHLN